MAVKHTIKTKDGLKTVELTRAKAIRAKCLDCSCWNSAEVRKCPITTCALWPFRFGSTQRPKGKVLDGTG